MKAQKQMEELDERLFELYTVLTEYSHGNQEAHALRRKTEEVLAMLRQEAEQPDRESLVRIKQEIKNTLFSPQGGLDEVTFWRDDYWERQKINEPIKRLTKELKNLTEI